MVSSPMFRRLVLRVLARARNKALLGADERLVALLAVSPSSHDWVCKLPITRTRLPLWMNRPHCSASFSQASTAVHSVSTMRLAIVVPPRRPWWQPES